MAEGDDTDLTPGRARIVTRRGDTVRRETGPWTPAVHALLRHLASVGFEGVPRVLDSDEPGREVLSFVAGEDGHHARRPALHADRALRDVARLVRRFHDAVTDFVPPPDAQWQYLADAPTTGIMCHNDLAPVNTIFRQDRPVGFIDWDYAAPAPPVWDIACAVWSFVPLADDAFCRRHGYPLGDRGPRLRMFCEAYGLGGADRLALLDVVRARELSMFETVRRGAEQGHGVYAEVWAATKGRRWVDAVAYLDANRDDWQAYLE